MRYDRLDLELDTRPGTQTGEGQTDNGRGCGAREDRRVCTSAHDVVPEERHSEPEGQHEQVGLQSGKLPRETGRLRTEIPKATCHQDTWEAGWWTQRQVKIQTGVEAK